MSTFQGEPQTISTITERVMDGMLEWQNRPLDPGRIPLVVANHRVIVQGPPSSHSLVRSEVIQA